MLTMVLAGGKIIFSAPLVFASAPISVSIALPAPVLDFSDLDVRDSENRPINSAAARQELQTLFVSSLNDLLLNNLTPARRLLALRRAQTWDIFSGWLTRALSKVFDRTLGWLQTRRDKKKPVIQQTSFSAPGPLGPWRPWGQPSFNFHSFLSPFISSTRLLL